MSEPNQATAQNPPLSQESRGGNIAPFVVEFADDNCRNFSIATPPLQGVDIRGRWDTSRMASRPQGMRDLGTYATRIPTPIFGMRLRIDVRKKIAELFDPLLTTDDGKAQLARYNAIAKVVPALRKDCKANDTVKFELDDDQLKTLLFDLFRKNESKCLIVIEGALPTAQQIDSLKGFEFYDPANNSDDKPRYKKDLPAWKERRRAVEA